MPEMKLLRVPSVPLITCDPYFSLWSPADHLYDADTQHWSDHIKRMHGIIEVDGTVYRFLGGEDGNPTPMQTGLLITATTSTYRFEIDGISFTVKFWTPLLLENLELVSRPCSYLDMSVETLDNSPHRVSFQIKVDEGFCYHGDEQKPMISDVLPTKEYTAAWMAQRSQRPLGHSGDGITIDWGTMYLAVLNGGPATVSSEVDGGRLQLMAKVDFGVITDKVSCPLLFAYDDTLSIFYFSHAVKGLWAKKGRTIFDAIADAFSQRDHLRDLCDALDSEISERAQKVAGEDYDLICSLAYRQTIAAHKLIEDEDGKVVFLSKECYSNGCIGTVDISYPSVPLYQPELIFGMLRPVFRFSRAPVWVADFAPHDVGRYPYATGQVYALKPFDGSIKLAHGARMPDGEVYPHYYSFPGGIDLYDDTSQMPVEECGNMLIMTAAASLYANDFTLAEENLDLLDKWCKYLIDHGVDPSDQLCTDDFAGHLAHNVNLAAKAIIGVAAYAIILDRLSADTGRNIFYADTEALQNRDPSPAAYISRYYKDHNITYRSARRTWIYALTLVSNLMMDQRYGGEVRFVCFNNLANTSGQSCIETPKEQVILSFCGFIYEQMSRSEAAWPLVIDGYTPTSRKPIEMQAAWNKNREKLILYFVNRCHEDTAVSLDFSQLGRKFSQATTVRMIAADGAVMETVKSQGNLRRECAYTAISIESPNTFAIPAFSFTEVVVS